MFVLCTFSVSELFSLIGINSSLGFFKYFNPFSVIAKDPKFSTFLSTIPSALKNHNKPFQNCSFFD